MIRLLVQTVVRSNFSSDPVILVWEHIGVRSIGSDHKATWVCTSIWEGLSSLFLVLLKTIKIPANINLETCFCIKEAFVVALTFRLTLD